MINTQTIETSGIKQCPTCAGELLARDKFCRHCGVNQNDSCGTAALTLDLLRYETKPLSENTATYQSLSGALINIVAQGVTARSLSYSASRGLTRLIALIATVPIWMLIILLSPMEAYSAARMITKQP